MSINDSGDDDTQIGRVAPLGCRVNSVDLDVCRTISWYQHCWWSWRWHAPYPVAVNARLRSIYLAAGFCAVYQARPNKLVMRAAPAISKAALDSASFAFGNGGSAWDSLSALSTATDQHLGWC